MVQTDNFTVNATEECPVSINITKLPDGVSGYTCGKLRERRLPGMSRSFPKNCV